jgi:DNA-binding NarL/FixJ family response regulator
MLDETAVSDQAPIRIFVIEDDERTRETLISFFSGSLLVAGNASSGEQAMRELPDAGADVAIVDLGLPGMSGIDLIRWAHGALPRLELMAHTVYDDRDVVLSALRAGASSYLLKGVGPRELERAIRELRAGGAPMSPRIARALLSELQAATAERDALSPRERQVLRLIDSGLSYKEAAQALSISTHTVHSHIKRIYEELHANSKRQALAEARRRGML